MTYNGKRTLAIVSLLLFVVAACGQKPGVHNAAGQFAGESGVALDAAGNPIAAGGEAAGVDAAGNPVNGATGVASNAKKKTSSIAAGANDTVGVTKDTIKIGFHAPLTGAAAVDLTDLKHGLNTYSKWLDSRGVNVHGRKTVTIFRDDTYKPSVAVEVCRELIQKEKVFMLIGGAGTDQIQACALEARRAGVPYLSAGVTEKVVDSLPNYLAFSMTYPDQAKPLAKLIRTFDANAHGGQGGRVWLDRCDDDNLACAPDPRAPGSAANPPANPRVAMVYSNTEGFHDARDEFVKEIGLPSCPGNLNELKGTYTESCLFLKPITKFTIQSAEAGTVVSQLRDRGIDIVYILTAPTNFGNILSPAETQGFRPRWVGIGLTMGINLFSSTTCARQRLSFQHSIFLNPWPGVDLPIANQWKSAWNNPNFGPSNPQDRDPNELHDIAFGLWGGSIVQHIMLHGAGPNLTRSGFIAAASKLQNASIAAVPDAAKLGVNMIYPNLNFGGNKFGGRNMHIIWANCDASPGRYTSFTTSGRSLTIEDI